MNTPGYQEFVNLPTQTIHDIVYSKNISISLLINGTRRWYLSQHFDAPPNDYSYLAGYLETSLVNTGHLLTMLAEYGVRRVFLPVYSEDQQDRHPAAHKILIKGIEKLTSHRALLTAYQRSGYTVRFYGDASYLPPAIINGLNQLPRSFSGKSQHHVYFGIEGGNPHNYLLALASEFSTTHGRAPCWEDMLELYYGDQNVRPIDILIAFNHIYARLGIPPLLDGNDRIYVTPVSPLVLTETALRKILYDRLYNHQDRGRMYTDLHPNEIRRLKEFYKANQDTVIGLTQKYENLCYPLPAPVWPQKMDEDQPDEVKYNAH
jgi:hypothetical protein